ncbi:porin [Pseudoduganella lutea]|uniref:Porin n=1 Tax=Pseudoduganella lutea TaxID=321985 RepID=A0A4P6L424_9BURK|nr:porin [Pseudoduganella lutea]QBE66055.1 porin [Pseudoduganella lutea]
MFQIDRTIRKYGNFASLKFAATAAMLAAACSNAHAQPTLRLTGLIDSYVGRNQLSGMSSAVASVGAGGMSTSWFGVTGTEDLGDGLQAEFALTSFFKPDTGAQGRFPTDTFFSRDANIGLKGRYGAVHIGAYTSPNFFPTVRFNPFGNSTVVSPLLLHSYVQTNGDRATWRNSIAGDTGWSNQVSYTTPEIDGFTLDLHYQFGEVAGHSGKRNVGARGSYTRGRLAMAAYVQRVAINNPLDAGLPRSALNAPGSPSRQLAWFVGAIGDAGFAKLFGTFQRASSDADVRDRTFQLGANVPAGGGAFLVSWANTRRSGPLDVPALARNTVSAGYDHYLSKRTDLYAVVMADRITGQERAHTAVAGIRHRF